jgi:hypothetical protein
LLRNDRERSSYTTAVTGYRIWKHECLHGKNLKQQQRKSVFCAVRAEKLYAGLNELVVRQSPAGKNMSTEEEDIVGIRHQATTGEAMQTEKTLCVLLLQ